MKSLEISPLETKKLTVYLVEKEYNEPFWLAEPLENGTPHRTFPQLFRPSIAFCKFLEKLAQRVKPHFATEEQGMRSRKEFLQENMIARIFSEKDIPCVPVDIHEDARGYLATQIEEKMQFRDQVLEALAKLPKTEGTKREYLIAYGQCLQREVEEEVRQASFGVRESWITMGILDRAREVDGEDDLTAIHLSSPEHTSAITRLLKDLEVHVEPIRLSKKVIPSSTKPTNSLELQELLQSLKIVAEPIVSKVPEETPSILFYLDTDKRASPFDICMAYDAGFKAVVPYENVSVEDAKKIVQDTMFSRGPKGVKQTCFFVGGRNAEKAEEVLESIRKTMFPPFEAGTIIDPCGAYTTAAAAVSKVEHEMEARRLGRLRDKTCAVFGTGPVGKTIAVLLTRLGCDVMVVSPNPHRPNGEQYIESVAETLRSKYGANLKGVFAPTTRKKIQILRKADVIFCASLEGVRVIDQELLNKLKLLKVMADTNAVPPLGIEGAKPEDEMRELAPGIFVIGALAIGKLKYQLERQILKEVKGNTRRVYSYKSAFQLARKLVAKEELAAKLTVTLNYSDG